jgi:hypothetical protein
MAEEFIDFTMLQKKGILQRSQELDGRNKEEGGIMDFSSVVSNPVREKSEGSVAGFDFLSSLAGMAEGNSSEGVGSGAGGQESSVGGNKMNEKLREINGQLDAFSERLSMIEERLRGLEKG